jgi:hypothetical protein
MKDTIVIVLLIILGLVGYDYYTNNRQMLVQPIAPTLYATPNAPIVVATQPKMQVIPTWTPQPIDFSATATAFFNSQPTQTPIVLVATRPAFESLPPQGPYTPDQIETCRATWDQGYQGQLSMFQQQYELCYNALMAQGYFN